MMMMIIIIIITRNSEHEVIYLQLHHLWYSSWH